MSAIATASGNSSLADAATIIKNACNSTTVPKPAVTFNYITEVSTAGCALCVGWAGSCLPVHGQLHWGALK
jgi:hypothetical protein